MLMAKNYNLTKLLKPYAQEKKWVALDEGNNRVVFSGNTIKELVGKIKGSHEKNLSIIQAIPDYSGFVPTD